MVIAPPPPSITTIPSRKPVREVKFKNNKGKTKREHSDDEES